MNSGLVSIPLCTYNGERYLRQQLESLCAQTHSRFEVIAVDDCSSDGTLAILHEFADRDPRVRVLLNSTNVGFRNNFELALSLCVGEYIAPCDQDDIWLPDKLSSLLGILDGHALAFCDSELMDTDGALLDQRLSDFMFMSTTSDTAAFALANCVSGHAMLFRRSLLDKALPVPTLFFYDWWLAAVATCNGGIVFSGNAKVRYRRHVASVTVQMDAAPIRNCNVSFEQKLMHWHEAGGRIAALSQLSGTQRDFFRRWAQLWQNRERQWISPALVCFMLRHHYRINSIKGVGWSRWKLLSRSMQYGVGWRLYSLIHWVCRCLKGVN
jgi:glycosyltransferase involved in cell wall biosynthesis